MLTASLNKYFLPSSVTATVTCPVLYQTYMQVFDGLSVFYLVELGEDDAGRGEEEEQDDEAAVDDERSQPPLPRLERQVLPETSLET